jgi:hypothetical protein
MQVEMTMLPLAPAASPDVANMTQEQITALLAQAYAQLAQRDAQIVHMQQETEKRQERIRLLETESAAKDAFWKRLSAQSDLAPVQLPREHWFFVERLMHRVQPDLILASVPASSLSAEQTADFLNTYCSLAQTLPVPRFAQGRRRSPASASPRVRGAAASSSSGAPEEAKRPEKPFQDLFREKVIQLLNPLLANSGREWRDTHSERYLYADFNARRFAWSPDGSLLATNFTKKPHASGLYAVLEFRPTKPVSTFSTDDMVQMYGYLQRMALDPVRGDSAGQRRQLGGEVWFYGALTDFRSVRYMRIMRTASESDYVMQCTGDVMLIPPVISSQVMRDTCNRNLQRFLDFLLWDFGVDLALRRFDGTVAADIVVGEEHARSHRSVLFSSYASLRPTDATQLGSEPLIKVVASGRVVECQRESEVVAALALHNLPNQPVLRVAPASSGLVGRNFVVSWPRFLSVESVNVKGSKVCINFATAIRAVAAIHSRGYVHRDLRQPNIVLKPASEEFKLYHNAIVIDYATAVRQGVQLTYDGLPLYWSQR